MGERLKRVREELGYTQKDIAEAVGGKLRSWQDYEAGKKMPGGGVIMGLSRLGINANWVLTGEGPMYREAAPDPHQQQIERDLNRLEHEIEEWEAPPKVAQEPEKYTVERRLKEISEDPDAQPRQRARADTMLALAFQDEVANRRRAARTQEALQRFRHAKADLQQAFEISGYRPPQIIADALYNAYLGGAITIEGILLLLDALQRQSAQHD